MRKVPENVDKRHKVWCIHCGVPLITVKTNRDHVPSKGLLRPPRKLDPAKMRVCAYCNASFSADEEYLIALIGAVLAGSTRPDPDQFSAASKVLSGNRKLRLRIAQAQARVTDFWGETQVTTIPEIERVLNVVVKNARGHLFQEFGEPVFGPPRSAWACPLHQLSPEQRRAFEFGAGASFAIWPPVGSRHMWRVAAGELAPGGWLVLQPDVYRHGPAEMPFTVKTVMHDYLATEVVWDG